MILATLGVLVLSGVLTGLVLGFARRLGWVDTPGARSSHRRPTPTGGGLGLIAALAVVGFAVGAAPLPGGEGGYPPFWALALGLALGLSLVGFLDDVRGVPAGVRFLLQLLAATVLTSALGVPYGGLQAVLVLALTWTMNAYNFMDGSDGMAGLQGVFSGGLLAVLLGAGGRPDLAAAAWAVCAACAGFLPWNFPRARGFLGDAGSVPLGLLIGGLGLAGALDGALTWTAAVLALALFHVDAGLTLLHRLWRRERWYTAHREHLYQRLIGHGWTHARVALAYLAVNVVIVTPAIVLSAAQTRNAVWIGAAAVVTLVIGWLAVSSRLGNNA